MELQEIQPMALITKPLSVSSPTVIRILKEVGESLKRNHVYLPQHLSIDEFKSIKNVSGTISFLFTDAASHRLINVVENRQLSHLEDYFLQYPLENRQAVRIVTMNMYSPYIKLVARCFPPHAQIVIDCFHIVQHLNRSLNSVWISIMNNRRYSQPIDYRKLKQQWKIVLKKQSDLNFTSYTTHQLYDGLMTEKMMVDYLTDLSPKLTQVYILVNRLKEALKSHDFQAFQYELNESKKVRLPPKSLDFPTKP